VGTALMTKPTIFIIHAMCFARTRSIGVDIDLQGAESALPMSVLADV